ncbi:MAG: hydrolase, partial [Porphyromonadaceae bacterium]|nr:hydrolase [Porphyromonadaceae bacterium]
MKKISFDSIKINKLSKSIQSLLMFLITALIIAFIAPKDQKFQYTFTEGKPWQYDLLTAPYDFPILKTDADLSAEQDSLCERQMPYYNLNADTLNAAINQWKIKFDTFKKGEHISDKYYNYVEDMLRQTYETGLMDEETKHNLREQDQLEVMLNLPQKGIVERVPITIFKTVKEAYLAILEDAPKGIDSDILKKMNIAELLWTNVKYNSELTSEVTSDELRKLSISTGIIQKGERIVDKGEIVDAHIFNILNSYKISYQSKMETTDKTIVFLATFVIIGLLFMAFWLYFVIFRPQFMDKRRNTILLVMLLLILIGITIVNTSLQLFNLYIIPFAMVPMIVRVFFDSRTAIFSNIICILSAALFVPYQYEFIVVQVLAGFVSVFSLRTLRTRVDIIRASFLVF